MAFPVEQIEQTTLDHQIAIAQQANAAADENALAMYRLGKSANTVKAQAADLQCFATFLATCGMGTFDLYTTLNDWKPITHGLVRSFQVQLIDIGYAIGTINRMISTIKAYAKIAPIADHEKQAIRNIKLLSRKEQAHIDSDREVTRRGAKKAIPTSVDHTVLASLMMPHDEETYAQARDRLMLCLMIEMGLRVSEVHSVTIEQFDLKAKKLTFYREKVSLVQTHHITRYTLMAARTVAGMIEHGSPWLSVTKGGKIGSQMSVRAMQKRVTFLFVKAGIVKVSPHDLRHAWATDMLKAGTDIKVMMSAGGWNSPAMPLRYVEESTIANEGIKQGW